jgi:hypothetical protein
MSLEVGEVIEVLRQADDGWWFGRKTQTAEPYREPQQEQWFPSNFTTIVPNIDLSKRGPFGLLFTSPL